MVCFWCFGCWFRESMVFNNNSPSMKNLNLHATGKHEFLTALKEKYNKLRQEISDNPNLSPSEKENQLKILNAQYKSERRNADYMLFSNQ